MLSPFSKRRSAPHALLFLTVTLAWGAFAASPALAQPQWSYVYHANALPNALPVSDAWTKQRLTGGRSRPTIENGHLRVSTAGQLQYVRGESVDPVLGQGELTIEVRSRTSASPVWGLVVGNTFNLGGSGRSSIGIWILPDVMRIETRLTSNLISISITPDDHVFRIARSVSGGNIRIFIDGALVWSGGLGQSVDTGPFPHQINLFYGDDTENVTDYVAYAAGSWSPAELPSPIPPYRLPFEGGPQRITLGPHCPDGSGHPDDTQAEALDFAMDEGTPVYAAAAGTIAYAGAGHGQNAGFGNYIRIDHPDGSRSYYAHLSQIGVSSGTVTGGQEIGRSGNSGTHTTGPHLHFQVLDSVATPVPIRDLDGISWVSGSAADPCTQDTNGAYGYATGPPVP
jgi:peptidase M23-like protein